jgi:hypothetical protein
MGECEEGWGERKSNEGGRREEERKEEEEEEVEIVEGSGGKQTEADEK